MADLHRILPQASAQLVEASRDIRESSVALLIGRATRKRRIERSLCSGRDVRAQRQSSGRDAVKNRCANALRITAHVMLGHARSIGGAVDGIDS